MKITVLGAKEITNVELSIYVPKGADEVFLGEEISIGAYAYEYSAKVGIKLTAFADSLARYGENALEKMIDTTELVVVFYDGFSKEARAALKYADEIGKAVKLVHCPSVLKFRF